MFGKCRPEGQTNHQHSSCDAQSATTHSENTHRLSDSAKGRILKLAFELRNRGYSESYLKTLITALNHISSRVSIEDASAASELVAKAKWRGSYKANLCDFYSHYCKFYSIAFCKPRYRKVNRIPRVPTEEKIDLIIWYASKKYAIIYRIAMECGLRPVEIGDLTLNDIDLDKGLISVCSAKHGNPRVVKLKDETRAMLKKYVGEHRFGLNDRLFPSGAVISNTYERLKASLSKKLCDSELKKIRLYDLRHYYATMLYYKTKDILLVKEKLGHRNINNTLIYTHLVSFSDSEEFYSATAKTVAEAAKLIEQGFDYVCDVDSVKLFRKRK
jgi:integrase